MRLAQVFCCVSLSVGALIALAGNACAQGASVELHEFSGKRTKGLLHEFSSTRVVLGGEPLQEFARKSLIALRFSDHKPVRADSGATVLLANGDVLHVSPTTIDEEFLTAQWIAFDKLPPIRIPLEHVQGVVLSPPSDRAARNRLTRAITDSTLTSDLILLKNRDRIAGTLSGLASERFSIERAAGEAVIARKDALAIALNPELLSVQKPRGPTLLLTLRDGSRMEMQQVLSKSEGRFACRTLFGSEIVLKREFVRSIRFLGGRAVYLSELVPDDIFYTPLFETMLFPLQTNRNVDGGPLRIRGVEFERGLGMHSKTSATWTLNKNYKAFEASVGIDDVSNGTGSAVFVVLLDGKPAWQSRELTGRDDAVRVPRLDVSEADQLTLVVEFGQHLDIGDHADWGNPLLTR